MIELQWRMNIDAYQTFQSNYKCNYGILYQKTRNHSFHPIFLADPWSTQDNYGRQRCMHTMSLKQRTSSQKCLFIQMFWTWQSLCNFSNILYTYKIVLYCCLTMAIFIFLVHQHRSRNFGNWSFTQFFLLHLTLICFWFWPKCWRQSSSYMNKTNYIQSV